MAKKERASHHTDPKLPYCTKPGILRKFLKLVPQKPKPAKVNNDLLHAWDLGGHNSNSILRVVKTVGLITDDNAPATGYTTFMSPTGGPAWLAAQIRRVYAPLFDASHLPHKDSDESLRRLFNIHSGGAEGTISYQIQTFKALCDHADFELHAPLGQQNTGDGSQDDPSGNKVNKNNSSGAQNISVHVDLHIHLPEGKSRRDYEYMFEDIARYIYGQKIAEEKDERK